MKHITLFFICVCSLLFSFTSCSDNEKEDDYTLKTGITNGHEWVDLGLSVKWATCNVGADSPSDCGEYFAWGELTEKTAYYDGNCLTYGQDLDDISGDPSYDVARQWGSSWRMPTLEEVEELRDKCKHEWTVMDGRYGYEVTGPNGNSIFFPAAGYYFEAQFLDEIGCYWTGTPYEEGNEQAYGLEFSAGPSSFNPGWSKRFLGKTVRPVTM